MRLSGWGNYPRVDCRVLTARGRDELADRVRSEATLIARGNGRAYGDAALNPRATLLTRRHDRILAFDRDTGRLTCESGVLLADLLDVFVPRGWFPPVTPGTKLVTIGGMIAADVHGKNHHGAGSFCHHVESLDLVLADGRTVTCSPMENADLFAATCGGMGLTGVIASATFRLQPIETGWIRQETVRCASLAETMERFEAAAGWTYSVAWIDGLSGGRREGRSLLYLGEHARLDDLGPKERQTPPLEPPRKRLRRVPVTFPDAVLNRYTVRAFNEFYYRRAMTGPALVDWDTFFYPLDSILEWNRIYGRSGFTQYQCVLPKEASAAGLHRLLETMAGAGLGSFLAVLKLLGPQETGLLSFPMEGYTLAMDFPMRRPTLGLLNELDAIVADHGGRIYLAKDARMGPDMMRAGYAVLDRFQDIRGRTGAPGRFTSCLAERLGL